MTISAVLLNWKRTPELKRICAQLNSFELVNEIIVWNNNPDLYLELKEEKTRVINCSEDFGLFTRFAAASLAKNECILFHDDDNMAPQSSLKTLYHKWQKNPKVCQSAFGRNPKKGKYSLNSHFGPVEIVLTCYVMVHRKIYVHALLKIPEFYDIQGIPFGNGEDIILSYAAIDLSGRLNKAYNIPIEYLSHVDEFAISQRFPEHIEHRTKIIKRCRKVFHYPLRLRLYNRLHQLYISLKIVTSRKMNKHS